MRRRSPEAVRANYEVDHSIQSIFRVSQSMLNIAFDDGSLFWRFDWNQGEREGEEERGRGGGGGGGY